MSASSGCDQNTLESLSLAWAVFWRSSCTVDGSRTCFSLVMRAGALHKQVGVLVRACVCMHVCVRARACSCGIWHLGRTGIHELIQQHCDNCRPSLRQWVPLLRI
jgi:hypothetical protein